MNSGDPQQIIIEFQDVSDKDASIFAQSLREAILDATSGVSVERRQEEGSTSQDGGTSLVVLVAAPLAVEVGKVIIKWLAKYVEAKLKIKQFDGTVIGERITRSESDLLIKMLENI
jgi:hypothetical protein